jgi:hypothetical protein
MNAIMLTGAMMLNCLLHVFERLPGERGHLLVCA